MVGILGIRTGSDSSPLRPYLHYTDETFSKFADCGVSGILRFTGRVRETEIRRGLRNFYSRRSLLPEPEQTLEPVEPTRPTVRHPELLSSLRVV